MTILVKQALKRFAKDGLARAGVKVAMKNMELLECSYGGFGRIDYAGKNEISINYVMIKDLKTGQEYQVNYGSIYNHTKCPFEVNLYPSMERLDCHNNLIHSRPGGYDGRKKVIRLYYKNGNILDMKCYDYIVKGHKLYYTTRTGVEMAHLAIIDMKYIDRVEEVTKNEK